MSDEIITPQRQSAVHALYQVAISLFFHRQGGSKITLPADQPCYAEGCLKFFEVQFRNI